MKDIFCQQIYRIIYVFEANLLEIRRKPPCCLSATAVFSALCYDLKMKLRYELVFLQMIILITAAWMGMNFSPGFSEMFVFAFVILTAAASVLRSVVITKRNKALKTAAEIIDNKLKIYWTGSWDPDNKN